MELELYIVDAFTEQQFKGNSAAVVPLNEWISEQTMQQIAIENNLSETAFIKQILSNEEDNATDQLHRFEIRWFSPLTEIDFCGHATLASSFIIYNVFGLTGNIEFVTLQVGNLTVQHLPDGRIEMSFPNQCPEPLDEIPISIINGLSIQPIRVLKNRQAYVAVLASPTDVINVTYNAKTIKTLAPYDLVVTACVKQCSSDSQCTDNSTVISEQSETYNQYDFVSRYFWPANGGDEDPVTGSIHAGLAPYWSSVLNTNNLTAYQASSRGGTLYCRVEEKRIFVSGFGVLYLQGKIRI